MAETPVLDRRKFLFGRLSAAPQEPMVAAIASSCLAFQGVACMSCRDACASGAVRFALAIGGARPQIEADACNGCGDCARACPADAIHLGHAEVSS